MPIQFHLTESHNRPGVEIVEILLEGRAVATITPGDTGHDIRLYSRYLAEADSFDVDENGIKLLTFDFKV